MATPIPTNRCALSLGEVARATGGAVVGDASTATTSVAIDTRAVTDGALFVALAGEKHDAHAFLPEAAARGARACVVRAGTATSLPRVEVADTLAALGALARFHADRERARRDLPSLAITGSAGKTTTKELAAAAARAHFGPTLATLGNLNNLVGVPMTLFTLEPSHAAMVIECGTNARGEIARLGAIVRPDAGLVLNADAAHTAGIGTLEDVADEKGAMFAAATRRAVANADDAVSRARASRAAGEVVLFGEAPEAHARLASRRATAEGRARITVALRPPLAPRETAVEVDLALLGHAAAIDAVAAIAGVAAMARAPLDGAALARIAAGLAEVRSTPGRMHARLAQGALVLDDTYNANPRSTRASIDTAAELAAARGTRLLVVFGDMFELGDVAERAHEEVGVRVATAGAAVFATVGPLAALAARAAARHAGGGPVVVETASTEDAAVAVAAVLRPGDVVLVKGSRGMRMERVVESLAGA